jgi:thiamine transport system permease protein
MDSSLRILDPEVLSALLLTVQWSVLSIGPALVLAHGLVAAFRGRGGFVLRWLSVLPGMFYALIVLRLLKLLAPDLRYSGLAVCLAWILAAVPFLAAAIGEGIRDLDPRGREAMRSLGAGGWKLWWHHDVLPTWRTQTSALLQQLAIFLTSFSIVVILGGGPPNETLEVGIFTSVRLDRVDPGKAWAMAFWQSLLLICIQFLLLRLRGQGVRGFLARPPSPRVRRNRWFPLVFLPTLLLLVMSRENPRDWVVPLLWSLGLSFMAAGGAVLWALGSYALGFRMVAGAGAWISPMILTYLAWSSGFRGFHPLVALAGVQAILFAPGLARSWYPLLDRCRTSELEAARSLGAAPLEAWIRVEWPRVRGPLQAGAAWVAALSLLESSTVMWFAGSGFDTLSGRVQTLFIRFRIADAEAGFAILCLLAYAFLWWGGRESA